MRTQASVQLIQLVRQLLVPDIGANHLLIPPDGGNEVAPRPELVAQKILQLAFHVLRNPDRALSFQIPASSWNTAPKCRRICPNSNYTTWYSHSHVAWFR